MLNTNIISFGGVSRLNKQTRTKLDMIRIEGICKMLLANIEHDELKRKIEVVTKSTEIKDAKSAIYRLSRSQLIKIIELSPNSITSNDIEHAYEHYRYGLKPGFTLYYIGKNSKKSYYKSNRKCY